jgi:hypothetical protein
MVGAWAAWAMISGGAGDIMVGASNISSVGSPMVFMAFMPPMMVLG